MKTISIDRPKQYNIHLLQPVIKCTIFLLLLFFLIFNINSRSINKSLANNNDINQNESSNSIVYNKVLNLFSFKNGCEHEIEVGQMSGLATSIQNPNQLFIFHRGSRQWNYESFPDGYHFDKNKFGVISENTILSVDIQTGEIRNEWGNNTFFMPHGLFIDNQENVWLTDVAMHQVFKYKDGQRILTLGELFIPGNDSSHFCKPTDVVVSNNGSNIYVSDGYCNSRIIKFNSKGIFIKQYSIPQGEQQFIIPHSLILIESLHLICVADRQNGRIVCFDTDYSNEGKIQYIIKHPIIKTVYAITYHQNKNCLYAISGKDPFNQPLGYTFSLHPKSFGHLIQTWKPTNNFGEPHDLALSIDGRYLFVGEIRPNRIHSFNIVN